MWLGVGIGIRDKDRDIVGYVVGDWLVMVLWIDRMCEYVLCI